MATGTISKEIYYVDNFNMPGFTVPAGSPGVYVTNVSCDIAKTGYRPIACSLRNFGHPGTYFAIVNFTDNNANAFIYRAVTTSASVTYNSGDVSVAVIYRKN